MTTVRAKSEFTYHDVNDDDTSTTGGIERPSTSEDLPMLAGIEARIATRRGSRDRRPSQKAASTALNSQPKLTSKEFAAKMKGRFVLKGPRPPNETTEGGSTDRSTNDIPQVADDGVEEDTTPAVPTTGTLIDIISQSLQGIDLPAELRGKYELDPTFQPIIAKPKDFRNFEVEGQLIYLKGQGRRALCIPKIAIKGRSAREIVISEAHSMLAHLGASKTIDYLRDHVWWKDMVSDVRAFCETCHTCKISKPSNQKPYGLLNPLSVPSYPWESIGMDFVGPLPESGNRDGQFDSITVVICLLTSMVHLIPSRTNYNASQLAELMFEHVYKLHGLPKNIISDRDVLFTSTFWGQLHRLIGTRLRLSSAYHPQSDGSTERANRTITQMLRQCVHPNQKDWVSKLPAIEFAVNSARSESTGYAPFFLNAGRMPRTMIWNSNSSTEFPSVREFALQKKLAIMSAHDSILSARVKQTRDANRKRRTASFRKGELVYLSTKNISFAKGLARKLLPKFIGPYRIIHDFTNSSFRLELPEHLKRRGVHDVFHASLLREHLPNDDHLFPGRMDTQIGDTPDTEGEWAVDRILSHAGSRTNSVFEIKWKSGDITWLPYYQITHLQALTDYLDLLGESQIRNLPNGTGKPPQEDPQLFAGALSFLPHPTPSPTTSVFERYKDQSQHRLPLQNILTFINPILPQYYPHSRPAIGYIHRTPMPRSRRPALPGVVHPLFSRITPTSYLIRDPDYPVHTTVHVGQIAEFLQFDEQLRAYPDDVDFTAIPIGFSEFGAAWNNGTIPGDRRRVSTVSLCDDPQDNSVSPSTHPLFLYEFHITPAQAGVVASTIAPPVSTAQDTVTNEFAFLMAERQRKQRQYVEERREKKARPFSAKASVLQPSASSYHAPSRRHLKNKIRKSHYRPPSYTSPQSTQPVEDLPPVAEFSDNEIPEDHTVAETEDTRTSAPMEVIA